MTLFLLVVAGALAGYLIPVLVSLFFSMLMGRMAPRVLSQGGRIKAGFLVMHGVVWTVASVGAGYSIGWIAPDFRWASCMAAAMLLVGGLLANVGEMKKQQGIARIGGMVLGTLVGLAGGLVIFLKTVPIDPGV